MTTKTKQKTKTNPKSKTNPSDYQGQISQDDKGKFWLKGGITPVGRVMWPAVFNSTLTFDGRQKSKTGQTTNENDKQFQCTLLFKKNDPKLKSMEKKIAELAKLGLSLTGKNPTFHSPIKDGNEKFNDDPENNVVYKNMRFIVLTKPARLEPPVVLDEHGEEMLAKEDFYPGCYAMANVAFKTYSTFGGGVTCYWSAIKKIGDGEKIGYDQSKAAKTDFAKETGTVSVDENGNVKY